MVRIAIAFAFLLAGQIATAQPKLEPDQIYVGGRIWTGDKTRPAAEALAVREGRIVAIGTTARIERLAGPKTVRTDLAGRRVVPGFNDAHVHFGMPRLDGLYGAGSVAEIQTRLRRRAGETPRSQWIVDGGWAYADFPDRVPHRKYIDAIIPDRPVEIDGRDGHMILVNSAALKLAGITRDTPDPPEGRIMRDAQGEPTGELTGYALPLVQNLVPRPDVAAVAALFRRDFANAAALGITSAQMMHDTDDTALAALDQLMRAGDITVRLTIAGGLPGGDDDPAPSLARAMTLRDRWHGPLVKFGVIKGILDGTIDARTGSMIEPLTDGSNGFGYYKQVDLDRLVALYDRHGFQVALHATGDTAIRQALDAFAAAARANGPRDRRNRIEHIDVPTATDLARLRPMGVIPSSQPNFGYPDSNNLQNYAVLLGKRMAHAQVYADLDAVSPVQPFGSDYPVSPMDALKAMHVAVTRTDVAGRPAGGWYPAQRIGVAAALRHFTADGAYASFSERDTGTLAVGKQADFVVLSRDILTDPPAALLEARVLLTVMGGRVTYTAP